ncbi:hypothetical protein HKX48_007316 [Thoreauomyces humboldtii]|nr:hypothetical protein HKX48_007316 [Thoreauomyces humboldtii]
MDSTRQQQQQQQQRSFPSYAQRIQKWNTDTSTTNSSSSRFRSSTSQYRPADHLPSHDPSDVPDDDADDELSTTTTISTTHFSMDSHLPSHNLGYRLLVKMGWSHGTGLGKHGEGRVDPVRIRVKEDLMGLGKYEELDTYHTESTKTRKTTESERQDGETVDEKVERETKVQRNEAILSEIRTVTSAFYCRLCDKQYSKISEYETHLSSYDHGHRQRFKDMQDMSKNGTLPGMQGTAKRKRTDAVDKEKAREEKELRRLQDAMLAAARQVQNQQQQQQNQFQNRAVPGSSSSVPSTDDLKVDHPVARPIDGATDSGGWGDATSAWTSMTDVPASNGGGGGGGGGFAGAGGFRMIDPDQSASSTPPPPPKPDSHVSVPVKPVVKMAFGVKKPAVTGGMKFSLKKK